MTGERVPTLPVSTDTVERYVGGTDVAACLATARRPLAFQMLPLFGDVSIP